MKFEIKFEAIVSGVVHVDAESRHDAIQILTDERHVLVSEAIAELAHLQSLLSECAGNGGDYKYNGVWYPALLIRESYFETYAQEMAEDIGAIDANASWPLQHIDWEDAANKLLMDYTSCEFDGVTYYYR